MSQTVGQSGGGPQPIWSVIQGFTAYWSVVAAIELGVFELLAEGPATSRQLAARCDALPRPMNILLGGLVASGLVTPQQDDGYQLTETAAAYLVRGQPGFMGQLVLQSPGPYENWPALAGTVRGQRAPHAVEEDGGSFHRLLVAATFATQHRTAGRTAELLGLTGSAPLRILDLGAGAAPWAVALLDSLPASTAVVNDLPEVIAIAKEQLVTRQLLGRAELLPGSYHEIALDPSGFDVVVLANVCRTETPTAAERLVSRAARALRPGGSLLVADYFVDDDRSGPPQALLLGVTMMASTDAGGTYTLGEARSWLEGSGMEFADRLTPMPPTTVLVARKADVTADKGS